MSEQTNPSDVSITRGRTMRWLVLLVSPVSAILLSYVFMNYLAGVFKLWPEVGIVTGLALGVLITIQLFERSFIRNSAVQAFVTINPLASLFGNKSSLVSYGPGTHVCFPWETRIGANNVDLSAVSENFVTTVQCIDGTVTIKGDFRVRPEVKLLPLFLSGVGDASGDYSGLINAKILDFVSKKTVAQALTEITSLNSFLATEIVHGSSEQSRGASDLEARYGLIFDDVTVSEMLPSKEVQETMGVLSESRILSQAIREFLCQTMGISTDKYDEARRNKEITDKHVEDARDRLMAMSGNLQGMKLDRTQFDLNINGLADLTPETAAALAQGVKAYSQVGRGGRGPQKGKT
jgi:hypothetical protein